MSTQIAVRLPDETVAFLDDQVSSGAAKSRAELISRAIQRERRRVEAERDAVIYASTPDDPELQAWVEHASRPSFDDLD